MAASGMETFPGFNPGSHLEDRREIYCRDVHASLNVESSTHQLCSWGWAFELRGCDNMTCWTLLWPFTMREASVGGWRQPTSTRTREPLRARVPSAGPGMGLSVFAAAFSLSVFQNFVE